MLVAVAGLVSLAAEPVAAARPHPPAAAATAPAPHPRGHRSTGSRARPRQPARSRAATPPQTGPCRPTPQRAALTTTWPQTRLGFREVWPVTEGAGVLVAVIDTGLNTDNPQLRGMRLHTGVNTIGTAGTEDCDAHGTEVAAIIAAQPRASSAFVGVAPQATIMPIKQTNTQNDRTGTSATLAAAIDAAVRAHARVANVSLTVPSDTPDVRAAVRRAGRAGMIIVAAVGNNGDHANRPAWPAAYSTRFANVIAVAASDRDDAVASYSGHRSYVDVAAPGSGYQVPTIPSAAGNFASVSGTSFAAPYVTGTVALMLAADPSLTPAQVRARLEQTADSPPTVTVPDRRYGYGIVDSDLAVTAALAAGPRPSITRRQPPVPAPRAAPAPNRHLQHLALAVALTLLALTVLVLVAAALLRARRRPVRGTTAPAREPARLG